MQFLHDSFFFFLAINFTAARSRRTRRGRGSRGRRRRRARRARRGRRAASNIMHAWRRHALTFGFKRSFTEKRAAARACCIRSVGPGTASIIVICRKCAANMCVGERKISPLHACLKQRPPPEESGRAPPSPCCRHISSNSGRRRPRTTGCRRSPHHPLKHGEVAMSARLKRHIFVTGLRITPPIVFTSTHSVIRWPSLKVGALSPKSSNAA